MKTKYQAKRHLIDQGIGFWTRFKKRIWCIRIAGDFHPGDLVPVISNSGTVRQLTLGPRIPNTEFSWLNSRGESVPGQLFQVAR